MGFKLHRRVSVMKFHIGSLSSSDDILMRKKTVYTVLSAFNASSVTL